MSLAHWQQVEREARRDNWRGLDAKGLPHPDECPKFALNGVAWSVPACGIRVSVGFGKDGVFAKVDGVDKWPNAAEIVRDIPVQDEELCEKCQQPTKSFLQIMADNAEHMKWLGKAMSLMCDLLDVYYQLTNEQKAELLSFPIGQPPEWPARLLEWCRGEGERD